MTTVNQPIKQGQVWNLEVRLHQKGAKTYGRAVYDSPKLLCDEAPDKNELLSILYSLYNSERDKVAIKEIIDITENPKHQMPTLKYITSPTYGGKKFDNTATWESASSPSRSVNVILTQQKILMVSNMRNKRKPHRFEYTYEETT